MEILEFGTKYHLLTHETLKRDSNQTDWEHTIIYKESLMFADNLEIECCETVKE